MATIIAVHGTNATGPEEGNRWWQRGSSFEKHLRECVESEEGALKLEPFVWDGANSEVSRRDAADRLLSRMKHLETAREPYCVVGHSHGGSIIGLALLKSAARKNPLQCLSSWITVGTPFIFSSRALFLFSRVGTAKKSILVSIVAVAMLLLATYGHFIPTFLGSEIPWQMTAVIFASVVPLLITYLAVWFLNANTLFMYRKQNIAYADRMFGKRWVSLSHKDDEAIEGLKYLNKVRYNIFKERMAVPALSFISIFVLPLSLLYVVTSPSIMMALAQSLDVELSAGGNSVLENLTYLMVFFREAVANASFLDPLKRFEGYWGALLFFFLPFAVVVLLSLVITYVVKILAIGVSWVLSKALDRIAWQQIKAAALGSDALGEYAGGVQGFPGWTALRFHSVPDALGDEIAEFCDREAAKTVSKLRKAIGRLGFAETGSDKAHTVESLLGWDELIHTSYFNVPRFRKLVTYSISRAAGFRATPAFKADPDYQLVAKWIEDMQTAAAVVDPLPPVVVAEHPSRELAPGAAAVRVAT